MWTDFQAVNLWNEIPEKLNPIRLHYGHIWRENFRKYGTVKGEQKLTFHQLEAIENRKKVAEMAEFAKFKIQDISEKIKEKLFKMKENELNENGIMTIDDEVSFCIRLTIEEKCLDNGSPTHEAKELANQVNLMSHSWGVQS